MEKINIVKLLEEINDSDEWTEDEHEAKIAPHNVGRESFKFLTQLGQLAVKAQENEWEIMAQTLSIMLLSLINGDEDRFLYYALQYHTDLMMRDRVKKIIKDDNKKSE